MLPRNSWHKFEALKRRRFSRVAQDLRGGGFLALTHYSPTSQSIASSCVLKAGNSRCEKLLKCS